MVVLLLLVSLLIFKPSIYNGWRQFYFIWPYILILGIYGIDILFKFGRYTKPPIVYNNKRGIYHKAPYFKSKKLLFYYGKMLKDPNIEPTVNLYNTLIYASGKLRDMERIEYFLNIQENLIFSSRIINVESIL